MPDEHGNTQAESDTQTPLHAYKEEDRRDEAKGDTDALVEGDREQMGQKRLEGEDEPQLPKH